MKHDYVGIAVSIIVGLVAGYATYQLMVTGDIRWIIPILIFLIYMLYFTWKLYKVWRNIKRLDKRLETLQEERLKQLQEGGDKE